MLKLSDSTRVYVASKSVDLCKAINGLAVLVLEQFSTPVNDGSVYVFYNRDFDRVKCLFWDKNGFVLYHKRLERGRFKFDKTGSQIPEEVDSSTPTETITYTRNKKNTSRKALPKSLPYIEKIHDLSDEEKQCACGCALTPIHDEITEQLDVLPQMTFRVVHIRKKYACKGCDETIRLAPLPKQPIEKSIATPGLLAAVINSKFNCHMPLYRQEAMFTAANISITRATLSHWLIRSAKLLTPLVKLMEANIQDYDIAYADETPLQVLRGHPESTCRRHARQ